MTHPVVFLCTGNAARSVMAGAALAAHLPDWHVTTAGTLVVEGQPMSWRTRAALESVGLQAPSHRSRQATDAELRHAALVIALAPEHVGWVRRTHPEASPRTATLRRLARDLPAHDAPLPERVASLHLDEVELGDWEEVVDPGGGDAADFATCAADVVELVSTLASAGGRMTEHLTPDEAVARILSVDAIGMPLGPGQPPGFIEALGRRTDWEDLRVMGALLSVLSDVFTHPNVHYLSGFYGPLERLLRDSGANIGFAPADFRRFMPLLAALAPRVMITAGAPPDRDGNVSLSLHAGANVDEMRRAAADPERLLIVEVSEEFPRTYGSGDHAHCFALHEIDILIESDKSPVETADPPPTEVDRAIAEHVRAFVPDGATLQTGIGSVPSVVATLLAEGDGGGYGVHSEMFTTGLMQLHRAGKITNQKGTYDGVSVATFAAGTRELYDWLHENHEVAFLPVDLVNSPEAIGRNRAMVTINAAMSVDIQGQVIADTISAVQYSGIGGHEDFVAGPALDLDDRSLLCMPSTITVGDELRSRIVPWFEAGAVITTPRHQVDVIVTEHGAAELQGKTVRQRGEALAAIAHPAFREGLREAAERASHGRAPFPSS